VLGGVIPDDIKSAYALENLRNMGQSYLIRLSSINKDMYAALRDGK
jgi:hypothetical protein